MNERLNPNVYISVLNWNSYEQTISCLRLLEKLDYDNYKIIIVDNASQDGSPEHIREAFPHLHLVIANENLGYAAGHRHTIDLALAEGAELIWLVNTDIDFKPDVLSTLVDAYLEHGDAIYGSVLLQADDPTRIGMHLLKPFGRRVPDPEAFAIKWGDKFSETFYGYPVLRTASVSGCSMLIPTGVVSCHGFMDDRFFLYAEERDYCYRLAKCAVPSIIVSKSEVHHLNQSSTHGNGVPAFVTDYYLNRNHLVILLRHHGIRHCVRKIFTKRNTRIILKYILDALNILSLLGKEIETQEVVKFMAIRDFLLNRLGKTISPDKYVEGA